MAVDFLLSSIATMFQWLLLLLVSKVESILLMPISTKGAIAAAAAITYYDVYTKGSDA